MLTTNFVSPRSGTVQKKVQLAFFRGEHRIKNLVRSIGYLSQIESFRINQFIVYRDDAVLPKQWDILSFEREFVVGIVFRKITHGCGVLHCRAPVRRSLRVSGESQRRLC